MPMSLEGNIAATVQGTILSFDSSGFDATRVQNASVVRVGSDYKLLYGGLPFGNNYQIGLATSTDGANWTKFSSDPVISNAGSQPWASFREIPITLLYESGTYKLWFDGDNRNLSSDQGYASGFGYATSSDGINWTMDANNPTRVELNNPSGNGFNLEEVVKFGGAYHAYYVDHNPSGDVQRHAVSSDGIHFTGDAPIGIATGYNLAAATTLSLGGVETVFAVLQKNGLSYWGTSTDGVNFNIGGQIDLPAGFGVSDVMFDNGLIKFFGTVGAGNVNWGFGNEVIQYATGSFAPVIPADADPEITFVSGVTADAKVAATSFWTWNTDNPATYGNSNYTYATLDDPASTSGTGTHAFGVNDVGQVVGFYTTSGITSGDHGFIYSNGTYVTLDDPFASAGTHAESINALGQVVGEYYTGGINGGPHGFLYSGGGYTTLDDPLGMYGTIARGINNYGQIVGYYFDKNGNPHGFLNNGGSYVTLDDPLATFGTFAYGINAGGKIVGYYVDNHNKEHGFLYDAGTYTTLDDPLSTNGTRANGINDQDQITGSYNTNVSHGFLYNNGNYTALDNPLIPSGGTVPRGINNLGQIAGDYLDGGFHGFLATTGQSAATKWGDTTLSAAGTSGGNVTYWFDATSNWTTAEKIALTSGLDLWSDEANITFSLAADAAHAQFTFILGAAGTGAGESPTASTSATVGSRSDGQAITAEISIDTRVDKFAVGGTFTQAGGYPYQTLVHEEGHLLGLGHAGPYNGNVDASVQQFSAYDMRLWTLMSYIDPTDTTAKYYDSYPVAGTDWGTDPEGNPFGPTTPMMLDILAVQRIYGAPTSGPLASGGQVFGFHSNITGGAGPYFDFTVNTHPVITIWDGGTDNTLDLSGWSTSAKINLNPGTFSSANGETNNIGIAEGTIIESAVGGSGGDVIIGGSVNNVLDGLAGNDTFTGGPGNDTLDGGAGLDTAIFSGLRWAYSITHIGTSLQISGPDGLDTLTNVERLAFDDITVPSVTPHDFDANFHGDILWQRDDATVAVWDNGQIGGAHWIANPGVVPASWHIADKGDFDGNGHGDILWRNDDGSVSIWDNGAIGGAHIVSGPGVVPNSWHISGTGDFDGNAHDDILWRNDDGSVSIWDNGAIGSAHIISGPGVVPNSWHISGTGDFDGNGQSDILWRNDNGAASIWDNGDINKAHIIAGAGSIPGGWSIAGTGDFDGNNQSDILWHRDDGTVAIWDNGQIGGAHWTADPGVVAASWHIAGTGDFDGNGHSDILWRNDNGAASIWDNGDINHAHIIADPGAIPGGWHIV